jgi:GNAT superfamily N-acetyltransferase
MQRESPHIRPAVESDVEAIATILRELGWFAHLNEEPLEVARERIGRHLSMCGADESHTVLVAQGPDGEAVGYVSAHWLPYLMLPGTEGYVSELFVREPARGKGVGRMLLDAVRDLAAERGCSRLMLITGSARESYVRGFYRKLGWQERPGMANLIFPMASPG